MDLSGGIEDGQVGPEIVDVMDLCDDSEEDSDICEIAVARTGPEFAEVVGVYDDSGEDSRDFHEISVARAAFYDQDGIFCAGVEKYRRGRDGVDRIKVMDKFDPLQEHLITDWYAEDIPGVWHTLDPDSLLSQFYLKKITKERQFELMLDVDNMKYIPLRSFEDVSAALNLEKHGFLMEGSCDLYSVKCVGDEKKLYKKIHEDLNAQHQRNIKEAAGMPKEFSSSFRESANLSRASPFGSLTNSGNRRKYAHLIAVLNATHSDHDFSNVLRPDDFVRIRSLDDAVTDIDHKIYDANSSKIPSGSQTPGGSALWNPKMWNTIDDEMDLRDCEIYQYKPLDDPFAEDGDSAFWDMHYFFLNVNRKSLQRRSDGKGKVVLRYVNNSRCCYLYLRATRQPVYYGWNNAAADEEYEEEVGKAGVHNVKRRHSVRESADFSASKRARYWFGDQVGDVEDYFYHKPDDHDDEGGFEGDDYDLCMLEAMRRGRDSNSAHSPEVVG